MAILVDTGVLLGAIDADDNDHSAAAGALDRYIGQLLVPVTVIAETAWQLERNVGPDAEADFLDAIVSGELTAVDLTPADYKRAGQLIRQYSTLHLGLVDASARRDCGAHGDHDNRNARQAPLHRCPADALQRVRTDPLTARLNDSFVGTDWSRTREITPLRAGTGHSRNHELPDQTV